jgi:hypothetical protein
MPTRPFLLRALLALLFALATVATIRYLALAEREEERTALLEQTEPQPSGRTDALHGLTAPIERGRAFHTLEVNGRQVAHALPEDLRALVFFFHGTGGSSDLVHQTEIQAVLQPLLHAGFGVVAPTMQSREPEGQFDTESPTGVNFDIDRMIAIHRGLREAGIITPDVPLFLIGYSAGGKFAGYAGHALQHAGLPLRAIAYHQARGRTVVFDAPPAVPSVWLAADHDTLVTPTWVAWEHAQHVEAGHTGLLLRHVPRPVTPGSLTRDPTIDTETAAKVHALLRTRGLLAADGTLLPRVAQDEELDRLTDALPPGLRAAVRNQLRVLAATHAFNGEYAAQELEFFLKHLDGPAPTTHKQRTPSR